MRRKYNREQKEYIETKKALEALEAREKELEANRYVETFSHAIGIPEEDFISYLEEKGLYKNNVNQKSE